MLAIKLQRIGKKNQPSYRIVVQEKRSKLNGRSIDDLGWYNPMNKESKVDGDKVKRWISSGAQPTATAHNLFVKQGIVSGAKRPVHKKIVAKKEETVAESASAASQ